MDAFRERFPSATEHGIGICTMRRCTHPMLFASGLSPSEAQTDTETWGPALQEIAMPVAPASGAVHQQHSLSGYLNCQASAACTGAEVTPAEHVVELTLCSQRTHLAERVPASWH